MPTLRDLPSVDLLLNAQPMSTLLALHGTHTVREAVRALQTQMRTSGEVPDWATEPAAYADHIVRQLRGQRYQPVFNLTGTVIHTNLGRALLSEALWQDVTPLITRPMNLEYDLQQGRRGARDEIIEQRLQLLTGCEAATVVNNNAAALMLVLNTFALGQSVPVSRGELIEIGGSFRLPELMARSGCHLTEVGTTNRTHLKDFANAAPEAAMLLKVHPSNYHISGFAQEVTASELANLAKKHDIPSCVDLGAGTFVDLSRWNLPVEPTPQSVLDQGIDLVTFSGDKLLGGVQAGLIVGKRALVDQIKSNPMKRALRADKITMAVLEATLKLYEHPETLTEHLPLLRALTLDQNTLTERADQVVNALAGSPVLARVVESTAQIGSGALPDKTIPSVAVTLTHTIESAQSLESQLRSLPTPVIGRIHNDEVWLDMRGADPLDELVGTLSQLRT